MNKKGMTLLELMVYMVIAALLLAPVIFLMRNSSVNMARDATVTDMRMSGRDILNIMLEDIRNTGFKIADGNPSNFNLKATYLGDTTGTGKTHWDFLCEDDRDGSSFKSRDAGDGNPFDSLTVLMYNDNVGGTPRVDTITYLVRDIDATGQGSLMRILKSRPNADTETRLARNVVALQFEFGVLEAPDNIVWRLDGFTESASISTSEIEDKMVTGYIRASIVLKDPKEIAAARPAPFEMGNYKHDPRNDPGQSDLALYERHRIVIPIPNNGRFPPHDCP